MTKIAVIKDAIENYVSTEDKVKLLCEYADDNGVDDYLYDMDSFDELLDGLTPSELVDRIFYGSFRPTDDYFHFDGQGNLESMEEQEADDYVVSYYLEEIAEAIENGELTAPAAVDEAIEAFENGEYDED